MNKELENLFGTNLGDVNIIPVMDVNSDNALDINNLPEMVPILTMRNAVLFPNTVIPITVGREKSLQLVKDAYKSDKIIGAVAQKDNNVEDPIMSDLFEVGTLAKIIKLIELPDGNVSAILQGVKRFKLVEQVSTTPYIYAKVEYLEDILPKKDEKEMISISDALKDQALKIVELDPTIPKEAAFAIRNIEGSEFLINFISTSLKLEDNLEKMALLTEDRVKIRAMRLLSMINKQIEILKLKENIQNKVRKELDQQQKEYFLNNQLKTIQEELGMDEGQDVNELQMLAKDKDWPDYAAETFQHELKKLQKANPNSPDYNIQYEYVKFILDLPWNKMTKDDMDLKKAQKILDQDHYGLEKVKERIIEYLSVLKLKKDMKSPIICLYGAPGVGKTSLGKSIARALGRKYRRISLGGLHDESEIRGHRRTYIGAMPGRIIQEINRAGSSNPILVLDEIDKINRDYNGDPSYALLEALDPEQNNKFHDNYLDIDYDLSKVMFITTANDISTIHPALRDRMEMIPISGYLAEEKVQIASQHLVPKELQANGLKKSQLKISEDALLTIVDQYTRESGVRGLEKQIAKIARVTAKKIAMDEVKSYTVNPKRVKEILGPPTNMHDLQKGNEAPGVITGLAWTQVGGEILFIECSKSEGKGLLTSTGNLGDVMKESTVIAHQYLKAHPELLNMTTKDIMSYDLHIHVPEGAIPKDGPSAGITMVTAMASALIGKKIKSGVAMTGEMTLRGRVLPVGGIKEKILAAKRAGVNTIILSEDNTKDIKDIPEKYIKDLTFNYVKTIDDVIKLVLPLNANKS
ncbi:MAG: endopeptidase La [Bacteroidales bacterium]